VLLEKLAIPGPYILVGHSYGGNIVRLFADQYPKDTAGLILEDAGHEDIQETHRKILKGKDLELFEAMVSREPSFSGGPGAEQKDRHLTNEQLRNCRPLPKIPLIVLTAGDRPDWPMFSEEAGKALAEAGMAFQKKLAKLAPGGEHIIVEGAGHNLHHDNPEVVIQAVRRMVEKIRGKKIEGP
jgi:pimeloyl-ACP methyl ester carboxylesterase